MSDPGADIVSSVLDKKVKLNPFFETAENIYAALGMMDDPAKRALFTALVAGGTYYAIKPSVSFDQKGNAKPWTLTSPKSSNSTLFPWFFVPLMGATFGGLFV